MSLEVSGWHAESHFHRSRTLISLCVTGVTHNIALLRDILTEPNFVSGNINTKYLPTIYPEGFKGNEWGNVVYNIHSSQRR